MSACLFCLAATSCATATVAAVDSLDRRPIYVDRYQHFDPVAREIRSRVESIAERVLTAKDSWVERCGNQLTERQVQNINEEVDEIVYNLRDLKRRWPFRIAPYDLGKLKQGRDYQKDGAKLTLDSTRPTGALKEILDSVDEAWIRVRSEKGCFRTSYYAEVRFSWKELESKLNDAWAQEDRLRQAYL